MSRFSEEGNELNNAKNILSHISTTMLCRSSSCTSVSDRSYLKEVFWFAGTHRAVSLPFGVQAPAGDPVQDRARRLPRAAVPLHRSR